MPRINLIKKKSRPRTRNKDIQQAIYQDKRWIRLRNYIRKETPLCYDCEVLGITKLGDEVHHIIPWETGKNQEEKERLAFDIDNLVHLCSSCHHKRHNQLRGWIKKHI